MGDRTPEEARNIDTVRKLFHPPPGFDPLEIFAEDAVWWNGLPKIAGGEGRTEHRGRAAIRRILTGSAAPLERFGVDAYDLSTVRYEDVVEIAEGPWVVRQHTMRTKTRSGRNYTNVYCFVFRFGPDGRVRHLTEPWNTWWAERVLFENWDLEPAHPTRDP